MSQLKLQKVTLEEMPHFAKRLQESFAIAIREHYGETDEAIPPYKDIISSFHAKGSHTYNFCLNDNIVGGVIVVINEETQHNSLDFFFIDSPYIGQHIGYQAWKLIEETYPKTNVWETVTPYFEERNIHFYVNKCGFHIVEFFNQYHKDPSMTSSKDDTHTTETIGEDCYFRFEKVMR